MQGPAAKPAACVAFLMSRLNEIELSEATCVRPLAPTEEIDSLDPVGTSRSPESSSRPAPARRPPRDRTGEDLRRRSGADPLYRPSTLDRRWMPLIESVEDVLTDRTRVANTPRTRPSSLWMNYAAREMRSTGRRLSPSRNRTCNVPPVVHRGNLAANVEDALTPRSPH